MYAVTLWNRRPTAFHIMYSFSKSETIQASYREVLLTGKFITEKSKFDLVLPWRRREGFCCSASERAGLSRGNWDCQSVPTPPGGQRWFRPCCGFRADAVLALQRPADPSVCSHRSSFPGPAAGYLTVDWTSDWHWDLWEFASHQPR